MFAMLSGLSANHRRRTPRWRDPRPTKSWAAPTSALASLSAAERQTQPALLDPCTTALDQDNQNDDNQHTGNNPDNQFSAHLDSSFLND
jgi:hypothetical protein